MRVTRKGNVDHKREYRLTCTECNAEFYASLGEADRVALADAAEKQANPPLLGVATYSCPNCLSPCLTDVFLNS
jgi:hypothetical protein